MCFTLQLRLCKLEQWLHLHLNGCSLLKTITIFLEDRVRGEVLGWMSEHMIAAAFLPTSYLEESTMNGQLVRSRFAGLQISWHCFHSVKSWKSKKKKNISKKNKKISFTQYYWIILKIFIVFKFLKIVCWICKILTLDHN